MGPIRVSPSMLMQQSCGIKGQLLQPLCQDVGGTVSLAVGSCTAKGPAHFENVPLTFPALRQMRSVFAAANVRGDVCSTVREHTERLCALHAQSKHSEHTAGWVE